MWGYPDALRWGTMAMKVEIFFVFVFLPKTGQKNHNLLLAL